jgi:hypothetical protein
MTFTVQWQYNYKPSASRFLNDEWKGRPDLSSVSEVSSYYKKQNTITILAVRPDKDDNLLSLSWNCAHVDDVKERWMLNRSQLFWKVIFPFFRTTILKCCQNHRSNVLNRRHDVLSALSQWSQPLHVSLTLWWTNILHFSAVAFLFTRLFTSRLSALHADRRLSL